MVLPASDQWELELRRKCHHAGLLRRDEPRARTMTQTGQGGGKKQPSPFLHSPSYLLLVFLLVGLMWVTWQGSFGELVHSLTSVLRVDWGDARGGENGKLPGKGTYLSRIVRKSFSMEVTLELRLREEEVPAMDRARKSHLADSPVSAWPCHSPSLHPCSVHIPHQRHVSHRPRQYKWTHSLGWRRNSTSGRSKGLYFLNTREEFAPKKECSYPGLLNERFRAAINSNVHKETSRKTNT